MKLSGKKILLLNCKKMRENFFSSAWIQYAQFQFSSKMSRWAPSLSRANRVNQYKYEPSSLKSKHSLNRPPRCFPDRARPCPTVPDRARPSPTEPDDKRFPTVPDQDRPCPTMPDYKPDHARHWPTMPDFNLTNNDQSLVDFHILVSLWTH